MGRCENEGVGGRREREEGCDKNGNNRGFNFSLFGSLLITVQTVTELFTQKYRNNKAMPQSLPGMSVSTSSACRLTSYISTVSHIWCDVDPADAQKHTSFSSVGQQFDLAWGCYANQKQFHTLLVHWWKSEAFKEVILCKDKNSVHHVMTPDAIKWVRNKRFMPCTEVNRVKSTILD